MSSINHPQSKHRREQEGARRAGAQRARARRYPELRVCKFYGSKEERALISARDLQYGKFDVVATSYEVALGLGRIVALYYRSSTLYHINEHIRHLCF